MKRRDELHKCVLLAGTLLALAPACAGETLDGNEASEPVAEVDQAITGGADVSINIPPYNSVAKIRWMIGPDMAMECTATKIGPRKFLTAAHCVEHMTVGQLLGLVNSLDGTIGLPGSILFTISALHMHPSWRIGFNNSRSRDLGVLEVGQDSPDIPTLPLRPDYLAPGSNGLDVGYGRDAHQPGDGPHHKQVAVLGSLSLAQLQAASPASDELDLASFTTNTIAGSGPDLVLNNGDSGGPLVTKTAARVFEIAAVNSSADGTFSVMARVTGARRWIQSPGVNVFADGERGYFLNGKSNLCIGVDGASTAEGASTGQYYCDGRHDLLDNQFWTLQAVDNPGEGQFEYFRIVNGKSGRCLSVKDGSIDVGARVVQSACGTNPNALDHQAWRFHQLNAGGYRLLNARSQRCLGVDHASMARDAQLFQFLCDGSLNQDWLFSR